MTRPRVKEGIFVVEVPLALVSSLRSGAAAGTFTFYVEAVVSNLENGRPWVFPGTLDHEPLGSDLEELRLAELGADLAAERWLRQDFEAYVWKLQRPRPLVLGEEDQR